MKNPFEAGQTQYLSIPDGEALESQQVSLFAVIRRTSGTGMAVVCEKYVPSSSGYSLEMSNATTAQLRINGASLLKAAVSEYSLIGGIYDQATTVVTVDGESTTGVLATPLANTTKPVYIGGRILANSFVGEIAEIIIYNRGITLLERNAIEAYVFLKYGVGSQPALLKPVFSLKTGTYSTASNLTISSGDDAAIEYSLVKPVQSWTPYVITSGSPRPVLTVNDGAGAVLSTTVTARCSKPGYISSEGEITLTKDGATAEIEREGLQLWLRAESITVADGGQIEKWEDQSGRGNHATSPVANRPTYVLVDPVANNKPTVKFDTGQYVSISDFGGLSPEKLTLVAISKRDAVTSATARIIDKGVDSGAYGLRYVSSVDKVRGAINSSGVESDSTAGLYQILCQTYDLKTQRLFINGEDAGSVDLTDPVIINDNPVVIGGRLATLSLKGGIAEVMIYNRALSAGERKAIELYAYQRYNIALPPQLDAPSFSRQNGVWDTAQMVSMNAVHGAEIYYTMNPTAQFDLADPAAGWVVYEGPVTIASSQTIRAIAVKNGYRDSLIASTAVIIDPASAGIPKDNLRLWLRADTLRLADSGKVSYWTDLSGAGNDFEQKTESRQPTYASSIPSLNGRPGVAFGVGSSFLVCKNVDALAESNFSIVAVVRYDSSALSTILSRQTLNASGVLIGYQVFCWTGNRPSFSVVTSTVGYSKTTSTLTGATKDSAYKSVAVIASPALHQLYADGVLVDESVPSVHGFVHGTTAARIGLRGGGDGYPFKGEIAEILFFDKVLTGVERVKIDSYIAQNYALPLPLPLKPKIIPETGTYAEAQTVRFEPTVGGAIHYSVDGNAPTELSPVASEGVLVENNTTVQAIELKAGFASYPYTNPNAAEEMTAVSKIIIDPSTIGLPRQGLKLWLRADSLSLPNDAPIELWEDQSGNLNHAVQENITLMPKFIAASPQLRNKPTVLFTHSPNSSFVIPKSASLKLNHSTVIAVSKRLSGSFVANIIAKGNPEGAKGYMLRMLNMTSVQSVINSYGAAATIAAATPPEYNLAMGRYDGATQELWLNGALAYTRDQANVINDYDYDANIGMSFHGEIAEILIYDHALGEAERRGVHDYLYQKYGVGPIATLEAPSFSLLSGTYRTPQSLTIAAQADSTIHYTTDGSDPTAVSAIYSIPLTLSASTTVKALAVRLGHADSIVSELRFTYSTKSVNNSPADDGTPVGYQTDTDGDGIQDAIEVALGTDPDDPGSKPADGRLRVYSYDKLYRLTDDGDRSYTYDREGNITSAPNP